MGTQFHISWVAKEDKRQFVQTQVEDRLHQINQKMSTYDPSSELSLINQSTQIPATWDVSAELADVISVSLDVFNKSGGLFDVTVGPLVNIWGFGPSPGKLKAPSSQLLEQAMAQVGSSHIRLEQNQLNISAQRYIDLSAVAKGWAVDDIAALLEKQGYNNYLVEIGGEIRTSGAKPDGNLWRIAIERPVAGAQRNVQLILTPGDRAVATSGDYRNYFEENGVRYSHTIDVRTGWPVKHKLASVTVIQHSAAYADAWATAINVAGPEEGMLLADRYNLAVYMVVRDQDGFKEQYSKQFSSWFPEETEEIRSHYR